MKSAHEIPHKHILDINFLDSLPFVSNQIKSKPIFKHDVV